MKDVVVYTKSYCPYCVNAKQFFDDRGIAYKEVDVEHDEKALQTMMERSRRRTVPQIFINNEPIGGFDELMSLAQSGELEGKLKGE